MNVVDNDQLDLNADKINDDGETNEFTNDGDIVDENYFMSVCQPSGSVFGKKSKCKKKNLLNLLMTELLG